MKRAIGSNLTCSDEHLVVKVSLPKKAIFSTVVHGFVRYYSIKFQEKSNWIYSFIPECKFTAAFTYAVFIVTYLQFTQNFQFAIKMY